MMPTGCEARNWCEANGSHALRLARISDIIWWPPASAAGNCFVVPWQRPGECAHLRSSFDRNRPTSLPRKGPFHAWT